MTHGEIVRTAAAVVMGENRTTAVELVYDVDDTLIVPTVCLTLYDPDPDSSPQHTTVNPADWLAALQNTATAKRWAVAAVNGVLSEALNSGDGVYRP